MNTHASSSLLFEDDEALVFPSPDQVSPAHVLDNMDSTPLFWPESIESQEYNSFEDTFDQQPAHFWMDEVIARTGPLSPCPYSPLPPSRCVSPPWSPLSTSWLSRGPSRACSPSPSALAPPVPGTPITVPVAAPSGFQFAPDPDLDDDELDEYVLRSPADASSAPISTTAPSTRMPPSPSPMPSTSSRDPSLNGTRTPMRGAPASQSPEPESQQSESASPKCRSPQPHRPLSTPATASPVEGNPEPDHTPSSVLSEKQGIASTVTTEGRENVARTHLAARRGKKRARQEAFPDGNKENEDTREDEAPVAGSSTAATTDAEPARKRTKPTQGPLRQVLFTPETGPNMCGLNQNACPYRLTRSNEDGKHLNTHVTYAADGLVHCTWPGCTRTFSQRDGLPRHVKDVHWRWKFVCTPCGNTFGRNDALGRHQKTCTRVKGAQA